VWPGSRPTGALLFCVKLEHNLTATGSRQSIVLGVKR